VGRKRNRTKDKV